jgi:hypothetical protein
VVIGDELTDKGGDGAGKERLLTHATITNSLTGTVSVFVIILIGNLEVTLWIIFGS